MSSDFHFQSQFLPAGDQPHAIKSIVSALRSKRTHHTLMGVTGSGKTYTMAKVIEDLGLSTLVMAPNKTLAAQLYMEFKEFFPSNSVGYFISYYDYYQPEAYLPSTDTYIAKDSSINETIDKMRHETTRGLFEEGKTIIVSSVSCIYGLGSPESYGKNVISVAVKDKLKQRDFILSLLAIQYSRDDRCLQRGSFRVRGDTIDVFPSHCSENAIRIVFFADTIESIVEIDIFSGQMQRAIDKLAIYPNSHYVADRKDIHKICQEILEDLGKRLREFQKLGRLDLAERIEQRTMQDIEYLEKLGFCPGIENYSRYLTGKLRGEPPPCLLDYFPKEFLTIIDESHLTVPQIRGMYHGDQARKRCLVDHAFRLPSALDNRPLNFNEFMARNHKVLYVSATPGPYELEVSKGSVSEQIIRPTGLLDPPILIRPARGQVDDLLGEIKEVLARGTRCLITTLTKKMAEDLSKHYEEQGIPIRYLHSDIDSLERVDLLRNLRAGTFSVLVGINLLREGLDLPEVQLVAVMDADKEGFLRSKTSLIQIVGRAARNHQSKVIFYADQVTQSMQNAIDETNRRRKKQFEHNLKMGITPQTIKKSLGKDIRTFYGLIEEKVLLEEKDKIDLNDLKLRMKKLGIFNLTSLEKKIRSKKKLMKKLSSQMKFEEAATVRDEIKELTAFMVVYG